MDKVKLYSQERGELEDFEALQPLIYTYVDQLTGALLGYIADGTQQWSGGCLTIPTIGSAPVNACPIGAFSFLSIETVSTGERRGRVVKYDPALPSQTQTTVNLLPYQAGSGLAWIWARRIPVDMDLDTRREWSGGAEVATNMLTRERSRVQFMASLTRPPDDALGNGWAPIARVTAWLAGVPTIAYLSALDTPDLAVNPNSDTETAYYAIGKGTGMLGLLAKMREVLALIRDSAGAETWVSVPPRGLKQLDANLATAEAELLNVATQNWYSTVISTFAYYDGVTWQLDSTFRISGFAWTNPGVFNFTITPAVMVGGGGVFNSLKSVRAGLKGTAAPAAAISFVCEILNATLGTFVIRTYNSAGTLVNPDASGFFIDVTALAT